MSGPVTDERARELIATALDSNMLVEAAAGTGKTTCMVGRMVALLRSGACADAGSLVAVTFTRKAAAELRSRFRLELERAFTAEGDQEAADRLRRALDGIDRCFIGTIHSFCARLLRERPVEAGVGLDFVEIDEEADFLLRREAWSDYAASLLASGSPVLEEMRALGLEPTDLEETFVGVFTSYPDVDEWPVPPARDDFGDIDEWAERLRGYLDHLEALEPSLPRRHGTDGLIPAIRDLLRKADHTEDLRDPAGLMGVIAVLDRRPRLIQKPWKQAGFDGQDAKDEAALWEDRRIELAEPLQRRWRARRYRVAVLAMLEAREVYDARRREMGALNFEDLLIEAARLLRAYPNVRGYFRARYTHVLVDEFQDTDPVQAEVLLRLTDGTDMTRDDWRECAPAPGSLFVVGDPKQSIYRFRRADIVTYRDVREIIVAEGRAGAGLVVPLSLNFRTIEPLISWVNEVFEPDGEGPADPAQAMERFGAEGSGESPSYVPLSHGRPEGEPGELSGLYTLTIPTSADGEDLTRKDLIVEYEAGRIARTIRHALDAGTTVPRTPPQFEERHRRHPDRDPRAVDPSDFMVITRGKKELGRYAAALQRYGVSHEVTGGSALNDVEELALLHRCLSAALRPEDPVALVGALRGELFGVSDAGLYRFKDAGGRFRYDSPVPESLDTPDREAIGDAFEMLRRYAGWLDSTPALPAIERVIDDLGLAARAAAGRGGDVRSGSLFKAVELLRSAGPEAWSAVHLVDYLGELASGQRLHDGVSSVPEDRPAVRVMNLHKVKGLEAPVVFLAGIYGESAHPVGLHVDRSGGAVRGFFALDRDRRTLACPEEWDELATVEQRFLNAELLRLRYVAATRAGAAMVVSTPAADGKNQYNPWKYFNPYLPAGRELDDPGDVEVRPAEEARVSPREVFGGINDILFSVRAVLAPTYDSRGAKEYALASDAEPTAHPGAAGAGGARPAPEGEHGVEWGEAIHLLLELAMRNPGADLSRWAASVLEQTGLDPGLEGRAIETVEAVMGSDIWARASKCARRLTEVPVEVFDESALLPTLIRAAIDLVFDEDGWVIVDYKTDLVPSPEAARALVEKYAPQLQLYSDMWARSTSSEVKEAGVFFVRTSEYFVIQHRGRP